MFKQLKGIRAIAIGTAAVLAVSSVAPVARAQRSEGQRSDGRRWEGQRSEDWEWTGNYQRLTRLNAGTFVRVRTSRPIESNRTDGRTFSGVVVEDVWDDYGRLIVPAIPRGSRVELVVRTAPDNDLILDLESIYAHGQRYAVQAAPERVESNRRSPSGHDAAALVGGGAILGTIIGSLAGGGKGAAIGATAGAATGLGILYHGRSIRVPAGSLLTFRLDRGLVMGAPQGHQHDRP